MRIPWLPGVATCFVLAMPVTASAQFMYRLNISSIGATTCTTAGAQTVVDGDLDWILPPSSDNLRVVRRVNGVAVETTVESVTPFNFDNFPLTLALFVLPVATPLPYTAQVEAIPFLNGAPVGTGYLASWNCDALGGGTFSAVAIAAPPPPVPAMSSGGVLALAALVALAGAAARRSRRRASG